MTKNTFSLWRQAKKFLLPLAAVGVAATIPFSAMAAERKKELVSPEKSPKACYEKKNDTVFVKGTLSTEMLVFSLSPDPSVPEELENLPVCTEEDIQKSDGSFSGRKKIRPHPQP